MDIKEFKKNAMRDALDKVHSWKQEHQDDYSRFSLDMMKMMRNDFSQLERIFKMAANMCLLPCLLSVRNCLLLTQIPFCLMMKRLPLQCALLTNDGVHRLSAVGAIFRSYWWG